MFKCPIKPIMTILFIFYYFCSEFRFKRKIFPVKIVISLNDVLNFLLENTGKFIYIFHLSFPRVCKWVHFVTLKVILNINLYHCRTNDTIIVKSNNVWEYFNNLMSEHNPIFLYSRVGCIWFKLMIMVLENIYYRWIIKLTKRVTRAN